MASEHLVTIQWERKTPDFAYKTYDRNHTWDFGHGVTVTASAAPKYLGDATKPDPEQALVAALSSCHMLSFLAFAVRDGFVVNSYDDDAVGILDFDAEEKMAITEVTLKPRVTFDPAKTPNAEQLEKLHHLAHEACFVANSVKTNVKVEI